MSPPSHPNSSLLEAQQVSFCRVTKVLYVVLLLLTFATIVTLWIDNFLSSTKLLSPQFNCLLLLLSITELLTICFALKISNTIASESIIESNMMVLNHLKLSSASFSVHFTVDLFMFFQITMRQFSNGK